MNEYNAAVKKRLKNIDTVKDFEDLLEKMFISEEDKQILTLIYKEQKTISYVADVIGLSDAAVKKRHHKLLMKVGKVIERTC